VLGAVINGFNSSRILMTPTTSIAASFIGSVRQESTAPPESLNSNHALSERPNEGNTLAVGKSPQHPSLLSKAVVVGLATVMAFALWYLLGLRHRT
jgi:hypothetical protein